MASRAPSLQQIFRPINSDLDRVTNRLLDALQNPIARMPVYIIPAGGKRLRPALVLLAGRSGKRHEARFPALRDLAAAIELVHTATLIHDDIIDRSSLRRKQPTFHERFGTERAVLMGDYLYAMAFAILGQLREPYVTAFMAEVCQQLSRGEFHEVDCRFNERLTEPEYLEIIRDKTASLFAASCHLGAYVAGASPHTVTRLTQFGWNLGLGFQIMDDCLDLMGQEKLMGKTLRSDLDKGSLSLPVIYLAQSLTARERRALFAPLRQHRPTTAFLSTVARQARRSGALQRALQTAEQYIAEAMKDIAMHDGIVLPETYHQLARYMTVRVQ